MRKRISNRLTMIKVTIDYCEKNSSAWSGIPIFGTVLNKVKVKKNEAEELEQLADTPTKGVTEDTRMRRRLMMEKAATCASATLAYANVAGNYKLAAEVNFSENKLRKMSKEKAMERCQGLKDAAQANIANVADYGIEPQDLTELQGLIDAYRGKAPQPTLAINKRKLAKERVAETVREIIDRLLMLQLDKLAETLRFSNRGFWYGYRQSRGIIDAGVVHTKLKGKVSDGEGAPLAGVKVLVYEAGTQKLVREAVSDKDGIFKVMRMAVGHFDISWELPGYAARVDKDVKAAAGKVVRRKVVLVGM